MKSLDKYLKDKKSLIFIDLEGTQFTHEIIEIGAYKVYIKPDFSIKKVFKPYKCYVKSKGKIGSFVTKLTGITPEKIAKEGVPFRVALQGLKKYVGKDWEKSLFVTFGPSDGTIFMASSDNNLDANRADANFVVHHMFDLCGFIHQFIQDEHGNPYSETNYLKLFEVDFAGEAHDAVVDAYNLIRLYKAFYERKDIVEREYSKTIRNNHKLPTPIARLMNRIYAGEKLGPEDLAAEIHDFLK